MVISYFIIYLLSLLHICIMYSTVVIIPKKKIHDYDVEYVSSRIKWYAQRIDQFLKKNDTPIFKVENFEFYTLLFWFFKMCVCINFLFLCYLFFLFIIILNLLFLIFFCVFMTFTRMTKRSKQINSKILTLQTPFLGNSIYMINVSFEALFGKDVIPNFENTYNLTILCNHHFTIIFNTIYISESANTADQKFSRAPERFVQH